MTHEYYVSFETAKLLKEAGFDWKCEYAFTPTTEMGDKAYRYNIGKSHNYNNREDYPFEIYSAPTLEVAQRWLREVKGYSIYPTYGGYKIYVLDINNSAGFSGTYELNSNLTYEEALEAGIKKALELMLKKQ